MELPETSLPTDNIYKTSFVLGLCIISLSIIPFYHKYQVEIEQVKLSGEIEELENKKMWLEEDGKKYSEEIAKLKELKKGRREELPRLDPNTEDHKKFYEATGHKADFNNTSAVFVIDVQKTKQAIEKKNKLVSEAQEKLQKMENDVVATARNVSVSAVQIKTKKDEILENNKFAVYQLKFGILGILLGVLLTIYGGYSWCTKTQKWQDRIVAKQASSKREKHNA